MWCFLSRPLGRCQRPQCTPERVLVSSRALPEPEACTEGAVVAQPRPPAMDFGGATCMRLKNLSLVLHFPSTILLPLLLNIWRLQSVHHSSLRLSHCLIPGKFHGSLDTVGSLPRIWLGLNRNRTAAGTQRLLGGHRKDLYSILRRY